MLKNASSLAIVGLDTAENGPSKVRQVTNKISANIGLLSLDEFHAMSDDERLVEVFSEMDVMCTNDEFFNSIDLDGEGSVSVDEFVKGVMRVQATWDLQSIHFWTLSEARSRLYQRRFF